MVSLLLINQSLNLLARSKKHDSKIWSRAPLTRESVNFSVELACLLFLTGQFFEVEIFRACFSAEDRCVGSAA